MKLCKTCGGGLLLIQITTSGDPEGIRRDLKCRNCGQQWGVTKAMMYRMGKLKKPPIKIFDNSIN